MKPKTKYSYFRHAANYCFGNLGGPAFLIRRDNKTGEFEVIYYNVKRVREALYNKEDCVGFVERGIWIAANQKEINKIKRLYREPKYLYYRHCNSEHFGNPKSVYKYIIRYNVKTGVFHSMLYDKKECNDIGKSHLWHDAINKGEWIPARQKEIKLAIKLNK